MSSSPLAASDRVATVDPIWIEVRNEAEELLGREAALGGFIFASVLSHERLEAAICHRLAQRPKGAATTARAWA